MPGTIFFRDTRDPQGIDGDGRQVLLFKPDDTIYLFFLPDGERFMMPDGYQVGTQDPKRPFVFPGDVAGPIKALVDCNLHTNRRDCPAHMVPDGHTLVFDGQNYWVEAPTPPTDPNSTPPPSPVPGKNPGCAVIPISVLMLAIAVACWLHF